MKGLKNQANCFRLEIVEKGEDLRAARQGET